MGYKRTGNSTGRPKRHNYTQEDLDFADYLLSDGASYREVAYTTGIPRQTLQDKFPGRGWTNGQGRAMIGFIASDDRRQTVFNELYDPARRKPWQPMRAAKAGIQAKLYAEVAYAG